MSILGSSEVQTHRYLFLQKQIVTFVNHFFKSWLDVVQVLEVHVGSTINHYGILSVLIDINVSHACGFILQNFPMQMDIPTFHLCLESMHGIIVAHLADKPASACKFADCDCLVGSFAAIGSHVLQGLDSLSLDWNFFDVEEVIGVGTAENADLLAFLHKIWINQYRSYIIEHSMY